MDLSSLAYVYYSCLLPSCRTVANLSSLVWATPVFVLNQEASVKTVIFCAIWEQKPKWAAVAVGWRAPLMPWQGCGRCLLCTASYSWTQHFLRALKWGLIVSQELNVLKGLNIEMGGKKNKQAKQEFVFVCLICIFWFTIVCQKELCVWIHSCHCCLFIFVCICALLSLPPV